jgi:hypothetical protein
MRRAAFLSVLALLTLTVACGSDGDDEGTVAPEGTVVSDDAAGDDAATTDDETEDDTDGPATGDDTDGPGAGDADDDGDAFASSEGLCALLDVDDVAGAAGLELAEGTDTFGGNVTQEIEWSTQGCSYATVEGDGEVEVSLAVDPEGGAAGLASALEAVSAADTMADDFPHQPVEGLGDSAFFEAGIRDHDLLVVSGERLLVVEGTDPEGEQLGQAEMQAVAEVALAALG